MQTFIMDYLAADIQLTSRCNLTCYGCWGAPRAYGDTDISLARFQWLIDNVLTNSKINTIVYDGGEPLLVENIEDYLSFAKSAGYTNILSTNAILLQDKKNVLDYLSAIGIPIDGPNSETNSFFRSPRSGNQFTKAIESIELLNSDYPNIRIKLGTVVTKRNLHLIKQISDLVCEKNLRINTWKLYHFLPNFGQNRYQKGVERALSISKQEYLNVFQEVITAFPQLNVVSYINPQNYGNILIGPDGALTTEMDENGIIEPRLGNVFSDPLSVTKNTIERIILQRNQTEMPKRIRNTYM